MTSLELLRHQLELVIWADDQQLDAAASLSADQLKKDFGFSFGSVHATLVHMYGAAYLWLNRLQGNDDLPYPTPADLPTLAVVRERWDAVHADWRTYLAGQTEEALDAPFEYGRRGKRYVSPLRAIIAHVLDHATHHRGQLNSLIKLAGGTMVEVGQMEWSRLHGESRML